MSVDTVPASSPTAGRSRRRALGVLCWLLLVPGAVWALVRGIGFDRGPVVQLLAFTPYVAAWSLVLAGLMLALRRWRPAVVAVLVAAALLTAVLPRALPALDRGAGGGPVVRVMTANVLAGVGDSATLIELIRRHRVDVLALQEFTPDFEKALDGHGIATLLPYREVNPELGTSGSGLYSRHPLSDGGVRRNGGGFSQAYATIAVPGAKPVLAESVHPLAPWSVGVLDGWRADLRGQPAATPDGEVRMLLGDFNSTLDHSPLRRLIATGYRDAADADGAGLVGTWGPYDGNPIPPVTIDHVLVDRRVKVREVAVHDVPGSDHRSIVAELALPPA